MNMYNIHFHGRVIATVYAITAGAALFAWSRSFGGFFPGTSALRTEDIGDEVARVANDPAGIAWARDFYRVSPRAAYRINHHHARHNVAQRHDYGSGE